MRDSARPVSPALISFSSMRFVFPSTLETFGIVLVEALAYEVPAIAAEVGAAREILGGGAAGWLLPDDRAASLTATLNEVLHHPVAAQARVRAGRARVEQFYDLDTNAAALAGWLRNASRRPWPRPGI